MKITEIIQNIYATLTGHVVAVDNPHDVTKAQVGLGNADDTADADKPVSTAQQAALDLKADDADLAAHVAAVDNPHDVTKAQVGLGNADDTADADKPVSTAQQAALDLKANDADLAAHAGNTENPHEVTARQAGAPALGEAITFTIFDTDRDAPHASEGAYLVSGIHNNRPYYRRRSFGGDDNWYVWHDGSIYRLSQAVDDLTGDTFSVNTGSSSSLYLRVFTGMGKTLGIDLLGNVVAALQASKGPVVETKSDAGDFGSDNFDGRHVINTADKTYKIYADGGWRTLADWT